MTGPRPQDNSPIPHLFAALGYCLLSLFVTYPLILHPATEAMGEHYFDRAQNIWNGWWVKTALLERGTNPFHTDLLFYPQGADLYFHTLNLPGVLLTLPVQLLAGPVAAYNAGVLLALTLAGYAGFRLVWYLTGSAAAGFVGGVIIGFNPLALVMIRGQINLVSLGWCVLCIECYLRAWAEGRRRDMVLTGLFFALALFTVGYFEIYLLLFFALHAIWALITPMRREPWPPRARIVAGRLLPLLVWGGGAALLLALPYGLGAWASIEGGQAIARSPGDAERTILDSADLLSFVVPNRDGWLLGGGAPWWGAVNPAIHDYTFLGVVPLALAAWAVVRRRRVASTWLWVGIAIGGVALALGPVLQINGRPTPLPTPFALLQYIPPLGFVRAPERFITLTYIALGVLGGIGILDFGFWILDFRSRRWVNHRPETAARRINPKSKIQNLKLPAGIAVALLLLEMAWHPRLTEALPVPNSLAILGREAAPGAVLELPLTQHGWVDTPRMFNQIGHGRPIMGGYLSRPVIDPYTQACSPFQAFTRYPRLAAQDIVSPTVAGQITPALLAENGVGFLAVYKQEFVNPRFLSPVAPAQLAALQALAAGLGTPIADDATATTYRVRPAAGQTGLFLQLGPDWHSLEESDGRPFRWLDGARGDLCVFSPAAQTAPLTFQVTSFATPRRLQIWLADRMVLETTVPADGTLHGVTTPALTWPAGPQRVRLVVPEGSASPAGLGQGGDQRQLSLGFSSIRLGEGARQSFANGGEQNPRPAGEGRVRGNFRPSEPPIRESSPPHPALSRRARVPSGEAGP